MPRCLLWHGWLPMLSGVNGASPWAADASERLLTWLRLLLGSTLLGWLLIGNLPDGFDADEVSAHLPDSPDIWSDGSLVMDSVTGVSGCWCRVFLLTILRLVE